MVRFTNKKTVSLPAAMQISRFFFYNNNLNATFKQKFTTTMYT